MENAQADTLVIKDEAGAYYLLPLATLQQGRVPAEHTAEVERLVAEQHDVQGHAAPLGFLVACSLIMLGTELGIGFGDEIVKSITLDSITEQMRGR